MAEETAPRHPDISDADVARAEKLFTTAGQQAEMGQREYAITLYINGLRFNPEAVEAHQQLRHAALQRKLKGGKPMGMLQKAKLAKGKTPLDQLLYHEELLAYDPGNVGYMAGVLKHALAGEYPQTVLWIGPILFRANAEAAKPDFNVYITLKDAFKRVGAYQQALDALSYAKDLKPSDGDLDHEYKDLSASLAMKRGRYSDDGGFTKSLRNRDSQQERIDEEKGIHTTEGMSGVVARAKQQYAEDPTEGKLFAYVDALLRSQDRESEDLALAELDKALKETGNNRFLRRAAEIKVKQMNRMEHGLREAAAAAPDDPDAQRDLADYVAFRNETELDMLQKVAKAYPNDNKLKFDVGRRLYTLERYDESIPFFQQAQADPKSRNKARLFLGRAFLMSEFHEEAVGTLRELVADYELEDDSTKEFRYWFGRALEANAEHDEAAKAYSKVTQADFNYRDTKDRLKAVRAAAKGA